jgi:hypothetical protein
LNEGLRDRVHDARARAAAHDDQVQMMLARRRAAVDEACS